jgi:hypothetical protein
MSSVFGSNYRYEQLFSLMKNAKSRTRFIDEHLEGCMRIAATLNLILKDYSNMSSAIYHTINFVKENY